MKLSTIVRPLSVAALAALLAGASIAQDKTDEAAPRVRVETTLGDFVIELNPSRAPLTVESFLKTVDSGFYAGTIFHRVIGGFIVQGGGYTADLELKPVDEHIVNESGNGLSNMRGTVGMARAEAPHSATTQFYVNIADNLDLNPRPTRWGYAVFGKVVEGMDVVDEIGQKPTGPQGPFDRGVPVEPVVIKNVVLLTD